MRLELVRDWMSRDVLSCTPETPAVEAGHMLVEHQIRRLPVLQDGRLVGIVTYGDLRAARPTIDGALDDLERAYRQSKLAVADVMTPDPFTVGADETIGRAAELMLEHKIGGVPVLDRDGGLMGIITESDIFRLVVHSWQRDAGDESAPYAHYGR
jgi:acetoin utilization protein AcuB